MPPPRQLYAIVFGGPFDPEFNFAQAQAAGAVGADEADGDEEAEGLLRWD